MTTHVSHLISSVPHHTPSPGYEATQHVSLLKSLLAAGLSALCLGYGEYIPSMDTTGDGMGRSGAHVH